MWREPQREAPATPMQEQPEGDEQWAEGEDGPVVVESPLNLSGEVTVVTVDQTMPVTLTAVVQEAPEDNSSLDDS